jgi:hypothetical protein
MRVSSAIWATYNFRVECALTLSEVSVRSRWCALLLFCAFTLPAVPQQFPTAPPPRRPGDTTPITDADDDRARLTRDMEKKAAKERVAALKSDTDKLLKLSVELKQYVDKSDENVLSLDVIRKADEIEKLAKSVKDKMKGPS